MGIYLTASTIEQIIFFQYFFFFFFFLHYENGLQFLMLSEFLLINLFILFILIDFIVDELICIGISFIIFILMAVDTSLWVLILVMLNYFTEDLSLLSDTDTELFLYRAERLLLLNKYIL
jgi:hypothetical protein